MIRPIRLQFAQQFAANIVSWLSPFCERIDVAGSLRRRHSVVKDIDLVAVPNGNLLFEEIKKTCLEKQWLLRNAPDFVDVSDCIMWQSGGIRVDLWCATQKTWGTVLMYRTGSIAHNEWIESGAKARGALWNPHDGLTIQGRTYSETEEEIYKALGVPYLHPEARDGNFPKIRA